jgi:hypothetical protein
MNLTRFLRITLSIITISLVDFSFSNAQSYLYNFDSGTNEGWVSYTQNGSAWERGTPTASGFQPAFTTPSCWGVDLDSGYRGNTIAYLTSPMMQISNLTDPYLSFRQFRYMPFGFDGFYLEYSTNGTTWQRLTNGLYADNWYNTTSVFTTALPGFTGNSNGWQQSGIHLNHLGPIDSIKLRFIFNSYIFGSAQPGVLIDQISLSQSSRTLNDMSAVTILSPTNTGNNVPITIRVKNNSAAPLDSFIVGYTINGTTTITTAARTIAAGAFDTLTIGYANIPTTVNSICVFARGRNDYNYSNDSLCVNLNTSTNYPVFENFESGSNGWVASTVDPSTQWELGYPFYGGFIGAYSGNSCWDVNLTSDYGPNAQAYLYSPIYSSATPFTKLEFKLRYALETNFDGMHVEYTNDNGLTWNILGTYNDIHGVNWYNAPSVNSFSGACWEGTSNSWVNAEYNLFQYGFIGNLQFRFVMHSDNFINNNGVSIDDFYLSNIGFNDLKTISVTSSQNAYPFGTNTGNIGIKVTNQGTSVLSLLYIGYKLNGALNYSTTLSGLALNPGDTATYFVPGFNVAQQINSLCGFCQVTGDINLNNDTACAILIGNNPISPNYFDDFDSGNNLWFADNNQSPGSSWELGFPAFGSTFGTHSGNNAWDINLTTPYASYANAFLYSPYFDLSNAVHPKLEFWQNRNSELNWDGLRLEVDYGTGWNILGYYGDFNATNWYTNPSLNSSQLPGWDGNSVGWQKSTYKLDGFSNQSSVQFRYVFTSDMSIETDGVSIDDFSIKQASQYDGALIQSSIFDTLLAGYSYPLSVYLQNQGIINISNLSIQYQLNNSPVVNQNWNGNLPLDSIALVGLPNFTPVGGWNILNIYINWPLDLDQQNNSITLYFYATYENDAALLAFTSPQNNIGQGNPTPVQVVLQNQGSFPLTNVSIKYTNNNGVPLNYNWFGNLPKDSTTLVTLPSFIPVGGTNNLKAYIDWPLDAIKSNDTIILNAFAIVTANLTYYYDFENGGQGWYDSSFTNYTKWELGSPSIFPTNFSNSGINCWDINLSTPYFNVAYANLYSPLFVISNYSKINIDFWLNYSTEYAADGTYLEYSLDGSNWEVLGTINDPNGTNWYNTTMFGNNVGWTGNSGGWKNCSYSFNNITGANILQLKFVFKSDINLSAAGISLDDITLQGVVGLNENTGASKYFLFPNPSNQSCHVVFPATTKEIHIMDANGKLIDQYTTQNETSRIISTADFSEGFYLIRFVDTNGTSSTRKLQVIH